MALGRQCRRYWPALLGGRRDDGIAVLGQQGLIGRDHMLAVRDGLQDQFTRRRIAPYQLDDDVELGIVDHRKGIVADRNAMIAAADPASVLPASNDLGGGGGGGGCSVASTANRYDLSLLLALAACGLLCSLVRVRTVR